MAVSCNQGNRFERVVRLMDEQIESRQIAAASIAVSCSGSVEWTWCGGRVAPTTSASLVTSQSRFLVASLTKPVAAAAFMRLVEEGAVALITPVAHVLPEFAGEGRDEIRAWHLLTHTSGLPNVLPDNDSLREQGAGLPDFFRCLCRVSPAFVPGSRVQYQSMGFVALARMAEVITGKPFEQYVKDELLRPAAMRTATLGLDVDDPGGEDVQVVLPAGQEAKSWNTNSQYWRRLGAPWAGLIASAPDLLRFLRVFLAHGYSVEGRRVLAAATVSEMRRDWLRGLGSSWGLGWKVRGSEPPPQYGQSGNAEPLGIPAGLRWTYDRSFMGDLVSRNAFGHDGASGCVMWADPTADLAVVILTTNQRSLQDGFLGRIGGVLSAAGGMRRHTD